MVRQYLANGGGRTALTDPNQVVHGEFNFERTHAWMKAQSFANGSDKFPGYVLAPIGKLASSGADRDPADLQSSAHGFPPP